MKLKGGLGGMTMMGDWMVVVVVMVVFMSLGVLLCMLGAGWVTRRAALLLLLFRCSTCLCEVEGAAVLHAGGATYLVCLSCMCVRVFFFSMFAVVMVSYFQHVHALSTCALDGNLKTPRIGKTPRI